MARSLPLLALSLSLAACATSRPTAEAASSRAEETEAPVGGVIVPLEVPAHVRAAVDATDRSDEDRALDKGRRPDLLLAFADVKPGMRVADLAAGRGYTTELLARVVGEEGQVFGQNSRFILERFAEGPWSARLEKPVMRNVVRVDRELDAPLPPEANELDLVVNVLFYHDTYWMEIDRAKMNAAIFAALKPGGRYLIVDHAAKEGAGASEVKTLHRVEESLVIEEIEAAGFRLAQEGLFLRNPDDDKSWNAAPGAAGERRGESDRFVLIFEKPAR